MISTTRYGSISRLALVIAMIAAITIVACGGKQAAAPPAAAPAPATALMAKIAVGDTVAAPFATSFYLARVESISGADASIRFADDGKEKTLPLKELRALEVRTWAVGDSVRASTSGGKFYEGRVTAVRSPGMYTFISENDVTTDVEAKYIIAP